MTEMTTETMTGAGAPADTIAPDQQHHPDLAAPGSDDGKQPQQTGATPDSGDDADKSLKRLQRRIDRVTAARYQAEARAQQLEAELDRYRQQPAAEQIDQDAVPRSEVDRIAATRAEEIASVRQVADRSNAVAAAGKKAYGEEAFAASLHAVIDEAGPLIDRYGRATPLGEAILDADKPAALLHYLGRNPDVSEQLAGLSPAALGRRIARIEADMQAKSAAPKPSSAPKPLSQPRGASAAHAIDPTDTRRWIEARNKAARHG